MTTVTGTTTTTEAGASPADLDLRSTLVRARETGGFFFAPRQRVSANWIAEGLLLGLLMLLPTAFLPGGVVAFAPLKASLVRCVALTVGVLAPPRLRQPVALLVVGVAGVATIVSIQPLLSFFGAFDRGMGWLTLAACCVLLLKVSEYDGRQRERLITALLIGAVPPCLYALIQGVGLDPLDWTTLGTPGSTLGSPTFLSGYLVLLAPFAAQRTIESAKHRPDGRYALWLALTLLIILTIVQTGIRGALLGLVVGALVFLASHMRRGLWLAAAAAIALAAALVAAGRFASVMQPGDSSVERLTAWRDAMALVLSRPDRWSFGFGPETQAAVMERAEATVRLTQNQQWDRVHNIVLDTVLTTGVLGLLVLAALYVVAFKHSLGTAIAASLAGHLVEQLFAFESVTSSMVVWIILGLALARPSMPRAANKLHFLALALVPLLAAPAIADGLYGAGKPDLAAHIAPWVEELPRAAGLALRHTDPARAQAELEQAAGRAPLDPTPQLRLLRLALERRDLAAADQACARAIARGPYRSSVWDACADVSAQAGDSAEAQARRAQAEILRRP